MHFLAHSARNFEVRLLVAGLAGALTSGVAVAADTTYTTDTDFDSGTLQSVNHDAPNNDQLQVSSTIEALPILYIANAGEDTVSKIDTDQDCEIARYRTGFNIGTHSAFTGPAPSRTAVDQDGNVYVANRHFDGRPAAVIKILAEGGIDRNGNGVIDTSMDLNNDCAIGAGEIIPLVDTNSNGVLEDAELADERVAWIRQVGPNNGLGRSLCIDPTDGNIFVGLYNSRRYYKLDTDGNLLDADGTGTNGYVSTGALSPYGCVVDSNGTLFSAGLSSLMGVMDNSMDPPVFTTLSHSGFGSNYGIGLGNGFVYLGQITPYLKYEIPAPPANPASGTFSRPTTSTNFGYAVSVDGNGDVLQGGNTVAKHTGTDDTVAWSTPNAFGNTSNRGVIPDANQDVWSVNLSNHSVSKFDGATGNFLVRVPVGVSPYTYSDASGSTLALTNPLGRWTVTTDGGAAGTVWDQISWNSEPEGNVPAGTSIGVEARAADSVAGLGGQTYVSVANGADPGLTGQFLQVRATLTPETGTGVSPVLSDLTVSSYDAPTVCDADGDGDVDFFDIRAIGAARNQPATGPDDMRDADGDGVITVLDARQCVLQCTNARCAP